MTRENQKDIAAKMRSDGLSYRKIAAALGVSLGTVRYWSNAEHREYEHKRYLRRMLDPKYRQQRNTHQRTRYATDPEYRQRKLNKNRERLRTNLISRCKQRLSNSRSDAERRGYLPCNATVEQLAEAYTGFCDCCGRHESGFKRLLVMDHCHVTGNFRGWLCDECNKGLGHLRDSWGDILNYLSPTHSQILLQALTRD